MSEKLKKLKKKRDKLMAKLQKTERKIFKRQVKECGMIIGFSPNPIIENSYPIPMPLTLEEKLERLFPTEDFAEDSPILE